jgi:predicted nucleic acid-binding Zn ribbon protein
MACKNCNIAITEEQRFCSNCGELTSAKRLQVRSIIASFFSNFLSVDNKFLKTFKDLTTKPELVIDSYCNGYRKNYINVIGYLGFAITLIGFQFFVLRRFFPELLVNDLIASSEALKVNDEVFNMEVFFDSFYEYQGFLTVLLMPVYAFASKLLFFDSKKYNLAEHFVINIYTNSHFFIFWFIITIITLPLGINYNMFVQISVIPMVIYMTYVFKRLFTIKVFDALARVVLYYILVYLVMIVILVIIGIAYGIYLGVTGQLTPINV